MKLAQRSKLILHLEGRKKRTMGLCIAWVTLEEPVFRFKTGLGVGMGAGDGVGVGLSGLKTILTETARLV